MASSRFRYIVYSDMASLSYPSFGIRIALNRAAPRALQRKAPIWLLVMFAVLFSLVFVLAGVQMHDAFKTSAYDLGIFDQAFWRYSQFLSPFNTVRGLNILGDHFSPIAMVFGPLYQIWPHITWALALQTVSVAAGGIVLFLIVREVLPNRPWIGLAIASSYYLHPAVHNTLLWQYHELVLASGLYMGLIWSYLRDRLRLFVLLLLLLLACREDMPFTLFAVGVMALFDKRWRYAAWAMILSALWWVLVTRVAMPYLNGVGYFRHTNGTLSTILANITNPLFYVERLQDPQSLRYIAQVMLPAGLLGLLAPRYLLPAMPTLAANVLIGNYNTRIDFHYSVSIMPFVFLAALMGMKKIEGLPRRFALTGRQWNGLAAGLVLAGSLGLGVTYSVMELPRAAEKYRAWQEASPKREFLRRLHREIGNQGVAASDFLLPHLSHREAIYLFPNPWKPHYWGIAETNPHHPNAVQYIVLSADAVGDYEKLYTYLLERKIFERVHDEHGMIVLKRIKPEAADRAEAIHDYLNFSEITPPAFHNIQISPAYPTAAHEFDRNHGEVAAWRSRSMRSVVPASRLEAGRMLHLQLGQEGESDYTTRYVRTELVVKQAMRIELELGSDDGITIWHNGRQVHKHIVLRSLNIEDDRVPLVLKPGRHVLLFRVNNATGASWLMARLRAQRCDAQCADAQPAPG